MGFRPKPPSRVEGQKSLEPIDAVETSRTGKTERATAASVTIGLVELANECQFQLDPRQGWEGAYLEMGISGQDRIDLFLSPGDHDSDHVFEIRLDLGSLLHLCLV